MSTKELSGDEGDAISATKQDEADTKAHSGKDFHAYGSRGGY